MELGEFGFGDVRLMEGERLDSALDLRKRNSGVFTDGPAVMLLTDQRIIHLHGNGRGRQAVFASIRDVDTAEIATEREGHGVFIWAGLAFIVALFLYFVLADYSTFRLVGSLAVAAMGVYLIADHLAGPGSSLLVFKAGASQVRCGLSSKRPLEEVYTFINRLFQLKSKDDNRGSTRISPFAPL